MQESLNNQNSNTEPLRGASFPPSSAGRAPHPNFTLHLGGPWFWNLVPKTVTREPFAYKVRAFVKEAELPLLDDCDIRGKIGRAKDSNFHFALYLYPDTDQQLVRAREIASRFSEATLLTRGHLLGREWVPGKPIAIDYTTRERRGS